MYLSCYDILPVQCFYSFGTDCVFCLSNKHAAGQLSVKSHCQILPTHLRWAYLKNIVTCFTEWHIWLCIRHIWTISSTQVLDQNQYEEAHLPLSHTFLCGRSSSALHRWATTIEKCLGEVETGRNLLPKHLSEQHLRSHLPWCLSVWVLRTSVQEPQMSLGLVERSQAKSRADSQKTRLPKTNQLEKSSGSSLPVPHTLHLPKKFYAYMWCEKLPFWFRDRKQEAHREVSAVQLKSRVCS